MRLTGLHALAVVAAVALPSGCTNAPAAAPSAQPASASATSGWILQMSVPAAGSTVNGPVNELVLHFSPPARLDEVSVAGPQGAMPMMITAVGEVQHYSLPLPGLGPGGYTVAWRSTAQGHEYQGSFKFTVR